jgi:hypothetical protein
VVSVLRTCMWTVVCTRACGRCHCHCQDLGEPWTSPKKVTKVTLAAKQQHTVIELAIVHALTSLDVCISSHACRALVFPCARHSASARISKSGVSHYDEIAALNGYVMIPFVMESYGGMCQEYRSCISIRCIIAAATLTASVLSGKDSCLH